MSKLALLKKYLSGSHKLLWLSLILASFSVILKMAIPFITGKAIDEIRNGNLDISVYLILIGACLVLGGLFRYFFNLSVQHLGQSVVKRLRNEVFSSINSLSVSYLDSHAHGDTLLRLINDIENVQNGLINGASSIYEGAVQILVTFIFMMTINWVLGLLVLILTPISVLISWKISSANTKYFKAQNSTLAALSATALESISLSQTIQAYGIEQEREGIFQAHNEENRFDNQKALFAGSLVNPGARLVNNIIYAAVVLLGVYFILYEPSWIGITLSIGGLSAFLTYSYQFMSPINEVSSVATEMIYAFVSLNRVDEIITAPKDIDEGTKSIGEVIDSLQAKGINFSYSEGKPIIKDFSIDIYKGHKIALVGPTGCGKTTIINLLMRFYDPQEGCFYANNISTLETPKQELRSHIGMVLQDTWLHQGTIEENIAFGKKEASHEEVVEAAIKAHADEFIRRLPLGYQTPLAMASSLSAGEKQLLCIARIVLCKPEIILLDEATSNIDLRTELALADAFDELMNGKTSLVVAHRLSTIRNADLILVINEGRIIEQGNFAELMAKQGYFSQLYNSQFI